MSASPVASFVVRRTFLDVQLEGSEELPYARPRAGTDTCIDYSFTDVIESDGAKGGSIDDISARGTTVGDGVSVAATDTSDCLSWASEMEQEAADMEIAQAAQTPFQCVATALEHMPMMCQQGAFFMMVPMASEKADDMEMEQSQTTTLVLRKLPKDWSSVHLRRMLDSSDFDALYDFIYVPRDFKSGRSLGYALVNFTEPKHALAAQELFHGARMGPGALVAELSRKHSGLSSLISQYQGSHVLTDESLPDEHKPQLLLDGKLIPFPKVESDLEILEEC